MIYYKCGFSQYRLVLNLLSSWNGKLLTRMIFFKANDIKLFSTMTKCELDLCNEGCIAWKNFPMVNPDYQLALISDNDNENLIYIVRHTVHYYNYFANKRPCCFLRNLRNFQWIITPIEFSVQISSSVYNKPLSSLFIFFN